MENREPRHGTGTSEEEIEHMGRGESTGCDVVFTVEARLGASATRIPGFGAPSGAAMEIGEPRHGAGTSEEEIEHMERGEPTGCDVMFTVEFAKEEAAVDQMERVGTRGRDVGVAEEVKGSNGVFASARHALIDAGARAAFYPTVLGSVVATWIKPDRRWWDRVYEYVLLGAVPFPGDVPVLKGLGVKAVITLTKSYETLVPSSTYKAHQISHLEIPTTDFAFAPSMNDIQDAIDCIHDHASRGDSTYVHCKAGKARSTTVVLCYLIKYRNMTPESALDHVKCRRPRVQLADAQWKAVKDFSSLVNNQINEQRDSEFVSITDEDLDGYEGRDS